MNKLPPIHVLAKPTGAECNLDCKYCFFLSKDNLYPEEKSSRMTDELLEKYIRQLCKQAGEEVNVAWQGGEPTLMGLKFFQRSVELANRYRKPGQRILHTIQTNGVLLDDDWCAFFKANQFLVGLSVDGPRPLHDTYRVDRSGNGSFDRVLRGWKLLRKHAVDVNILCTVHAANVEHPLEVYRFFRDEMQAEYLQFIPIVERATPELLLLANRGWGERAGAKRPLYVQQGTLVTERSVDAVRFGQFLIAIYDEWVLQDVGKIFVQTFDVALGSWFGQHNLCVFSPECGLSLALEHNGDIYSCDHFVESGYRLGSIVDADLAEIASSPQQQQFGYDKFARLPQYCRECEVLFACYGECPRNRFITAPDGTPGLNYLCAGYKQFFKHVGPTMQMMKKLIQQRRYADEVMQLLKTNDYAAKENAELARAGKEG
ncbi:MAG TPA: anaerobic sulfatase maturase [Negativicutes bacterium]|nr:anaerobic sulfatase maturase [Negativicutes bacterium]